MATSGTAVRFGVPFTEFDTVFFGLGAERTSIRDTPSLPSSYQQYRNDFGAVSYSLPLTLGWQRDQRDSVLTPSAGRYQRVNLEWGVGGDVRYLRSNLQYQEYWSLPARLPFGLNAGVGLGQGPSLIHI